MVTHEPVDPSAPRRALRLFFAAWPPPRTARALNAWAAALARAGGRAVPAESIHLTLAFLGDVAFDRLREAIDAGRRVAGEVHSVPLTRSGYWSRARVVFAGPAEPPTALAALAANLAHALAEGGFALERRAFRPHVTLVRNAPKPQTLPPLPPAPDLAWPVTQFVLVHSLVGSAGSRYEIMRRFRLGRNARA